MRQGLWRRRQSVVGPNGLRPPSGQPVYVAVVDPGVSALRVLDVCVSGRPPEVWGWAESARQDGASHLEGALRLGNDLEQALATAEKMGKDRAPRWQAADQMVVGLPASQLRGWSWPIAQRRPQPDRIIEEKELEALLARALRLAISRLKEPTEKSWLLVDAAPVALTVDGRGVTDPIGFRGAEIGASVFVALAPTSIIEAWKAATKGFGFSALTLTAAPVALAACLADPQALVLDVGGATTSLTWCRGGIPVAIDSFPVGGSSLTDTLLRKWGLSQGRAEALKRTYAAGQLTRQAESQVLDTMAPAVRSWSELLESALAAVNEKADEPLPHQLYLCGGASTLAEMVEAARSLAWSRQLEFARYPQVAQFQPTAVPGVANCTDAGRAAGDVMALALAAWAGRQSQPSSRPERILRKMCES